EESTDSRITEIENLSQKFGTYCIEDDTPLILSSKSEIAVDAKLNCSLFDFQRRGIQQMFQSFSNGSGAIINDVPGSGKKVQVVAFISALISSQRRTESGEFFSARVYPALIICPRPKIHVWESRIKQWSSLKHSVCSDLDISKAADSTDVVLFPFDLLAKSVVNVAKRKWTVLFVDNIEVITLKQKYELLLHHLPRDPRFGISSKILDDSETLATIVGWVSPSYYEQFKRDRSNILSFIKQFDSKSGPKADQIRGLHLKANLLSIRNEVFIKRDGRVPEALLDIPRDAEEVDFDLHPSTSQAKRAPPKANKRRSNEKVKPKVKSPRLSSRDRAPTHDISDDDGDIEDNDGGGDYSARTRQGSATNEEEEVFRRLPRRTRARSNDLEALSNVEAKPTTSSESSRRSMDRSPEPQPSCSRSSKTEELKSDLRPSNTSDINHNSDYDKLDALFFSSTKVLKSPKKSRKRAPPSQQEQTNTEFSDARESSDVADTQASMGVFGDFRTQQLELLNSVFLKTPPVSKPPPSKFKSFTQASQKTKTVRERIDGKLSETDKEAPISQDLDSFFESQTKKPPPRKPGDSKIFCSQRPEDLLDDILFSQPVARKGPPKKKFFTQTAALSDAGSSSRQPMQPIKNQAVKSDQNSPLFD
ncbi:unnamed protein product, partial [Bemisia tabaci]